MQKINIRIGDSSVVLVEMEPESVWAVVCDPPYDLVAQSSGSGGFMGKKWDSTGIAFSVSFWEEVYRVLKPGGILKSFGGTRTFHKMAEAIEGAGFINLSLEAWLYSSGFPKSLNISKQIDKQAGRIGQSTLELKRAIRALLEAAGLTLTKFNEECGFEASGYLRESSTWVAVLPSEEKWAVMRRVLNANGTLDKAFKAAQREVVGHSASGLHRGSGTTVSFGEGVDQRIVDITAPASDSAHHWRGWGTALKPSWEPVIIARKPS